MNNAASKPAAFYNAQGVRIAPYTAQELFMLDRADGVTWAERYRARQAHRKTLPQLRWKTQADLLDEQEAAEIAADEASMAR
jgi:hypothetical protein